jgi:hypothetical protein
MKKQILLLVAFLSCSFGAFAQSTTNVSGGQAKLGDDTYSYSVGEMALIKTESNSSITVTQGLLQPMSASPTSTQDVVISQDELLIYPNPTSGLVNVAPKFKKGGDLQLIVLDLSGKLIFKKKVTLDQGSELQQFDMSTVANGNYILNVQYEGGNTISKNTYKIQKINNN